MPSILFVCTANLFRSPLAASSLSHYLALKNISEEWKVESAGTWAMDGLPALPVTKDNAKRLGLVGLENHQSRIVNFELLNNFDLIIVMESGHKEALNAEFKIFRRRIFLFLEIVENIQEDFPDPIRLGTSTDEAAIRLHYLVQNNAGKILDLAIKLHNFSINDV